jgi:putative hydrolase of the HAD superfamily
MLRRETKFDNLESFFTKAFYSHELKMRKPDKEIYEYVIRDARINPEETLFIDDTHTNFDEAEKLGIKTYLLLPDERIEMLTLERFS